MTCAMGRTLESPDWDALTENPENNSDITRFVGTRLLSATRHVPM